MNIVTPENIKASPLAQKGADTSVLRSFADDLRKSTIHKDREWDAHLTALLAGHNIFYHGVPGTAKSWMVNLLGERLVLEPNDPNVAVFSIAMDPYMTPDHLLGPSSISALRQDRQARNLAGRLGNCYLAFVDEVYEATGGTAKALHGAMNERTIENDSKIVRIPVLSIAGASNKMPSKDLAASLDRWGMKIHAQPTPRKMRDQFRVLHASGKPPVGATLHIDQLRALQYRASQATITDTVWSALMDILARLEDELKVIISDRRIMWLQDFLQAHAVLEGRDVTRPTDLRVLTDALWSNPQDRQKIDDLVAEYAGTDGVDSAISQALSEADSICRAFLKKFPTLIGKDRYNSAGEAARRIMSSAKGLETMRENIDATDTEAHAQIDAATIQIKELIKQVHSQALQAPKP